MDSQGCIHKFLRNEVKTLQGRQQLIMSEHVHEKPRRSGWSSAIFIIFVEFAERFAFYGLLGNLMIYLTTVLGKATATAAKDVNTWVGVSAILPLCGAFLADSFFGRFKTIIVSCTIYFLGMLLLTLSVSVVPWNQREIAFFIGLYVLSIGGGGFRPCVQPFAADQFDERKPEEVEAKNSFFNWWYVAIMGGMFFSTLVVITLQDYVGWAAGFGVLAATMAFALTLFVMGNKRYKIQGAMGSPFTMVAQVLVAAFRKWDINPRDHKLDGWDICYEEIGGAPAEDRGSLARTKQFKFLDKAMVIDAVDASRNTRNPWRLCSLNQVEEVKLFIRLIPIWLSSLIFTNVNCMFSTFFIKQGSTMIRSIGPLHFPPSGLQCLVASLIIITIPIYDRVFVPTVRKVTGHPSGITILQRIGIGLCLSVLQMIVAALVEAKRVSIAEEYGLLDRPKAIIPISVWWLLPQYIIGAVADVFVLVGLPQLFYDEMPKALRSLGGACYLSAIGVGSFLNSAIISMVQAISSRYGSRWLGDNLNRAHLDYFYWVMAALGTLNLCAYLLITRSFVYRKAEWDEANDETGVH